MSKIKVAIVTGSNKGIGFATVKGLCQRFDGVVYLTSRDDERGREAVKKLKQLSLNPAYHQLDVADEESVKTFSEYIKDKHGGIDILINNAGIGSGFSFSYKIKKSIIDINYRSLLTVEKYLFPLLRNNARVVNVSSDMGHLSNVKNKNWIERLSRRDLSREDIEDFINWYLEAEKTGTFNRENIPGFGAAPAYKVSKVAMCALTMIQQRELEPRGISINSMHPGFVSTDMTYHMGIPPEKAAKTPLYLVLDAPLSLKGKYIWFNKKEVDWYDYENDCVLKPSLVFKKFVKNIFKCPLKVMSFPAVWVIALSLSLVVVYTKFKGDLVNTTGFD